MATSSRRTPPGRSTWIRWGCGLAVVAVAVAGCTSGDRIVPAHAAPRSTPPSAPASSAPPCTGADGRTIVEKLFADLSRGKKIDLGTYFVDPLDFVRWVDPGAYVTFLPGNDGSVNLDALQSRLDRLERQHVRVDMTEFADAGSGGDTTNHDLGGYFSFKIRIRLSAAAPMSDGTGKGAIDCVTKKIKVMVIESP
ncbi:MAG TPA: hypothetical protein VH442_01040 [Micromonosporaceae bacterium]